ncbi:carboxylate--amine ligase/circularly permuted type 2 ATP-grasp protein [Spirilliplanes yamanashiensis]|uniref:carboxylate--amine ligase/circularly permuted type 2 ATP-grasp protein n=1 Tax=Spirilliplanes yamanashiensis TaxID=42233 RepID=UPI001EF1A6A0|nr:carboxylate--amine ligase/circularly permuted type 2 ATP-grasp protein [Spirilliplanes yamanashiensis]MDP9819274.1 carboxylate-amine ligase [Spirilliplanes yamanashiensis]
MAVPAGGVELTLGVEEELHVVDLETRELTPRAPELLDRLDPASYSAELHRSVVETNTAVCGSLDELRDDVVRLRRRAIDVAAGAGLGLVAAGTVPLVDTDRLSVTPTSRYRRMLDEYQMLVREQLICGAQVHVGVPDRDEAVYVAQRVAPALPVLLALSASSPYWLGEDSGYASARSLIWLRWPTAGDPGVIRSAAEHDELVADLIASGTISDPKMVYFDVRPSSHVPTVELRVTDACPDVDTVVLLAGLFRALVRREQAAYRAGVPLTAGRPPLHRAAMWRAARSGLEGDLLDLPRSPVPVPAAVAVERLIADLRDELAANGDLDQVTDLSVQALSRGSAAARQRRALARRGRLSDVVDLVVADTRGGATAVAPPQVRPVTLRPYVSAGDEVFAAGVAEPAYDEVVGAMVALGAGGLRAREDARDEEQRARGVTFSVAGEAATRLFPFDLVPRIVPADDWERLSAGLTQRVRALDAFVRDVYTDRAVVADGVVPEWVITGSPELRPSGALAPADGVRAHVAGVDLVRDGAGNWCVLEDNLRVPSGIGYAMQNRRLTRAVFPELPMPAEVLDVERTPRLLREALLHAARCDDPQLVVLSQGPDDSAWFEHRLLAEEMGVPLVRSTDLLVTDNRVELHRGGGRRRVDVVYLRMGEDSVVHSPGADGLPLGPSLLAAVHAGTVVLANALGNGIGDDKSVYAFVPKLVEYYLGEKPLLADVPTYLCGIPEQRAEVLARLDELVCKPVDGYGGDRIVIGPKASPEDLSAVRRQILTAPHRWVAQEVVDLSTAPVFDGHGLAPRHVDLRAFVFTGQRQVVAPVALTRVAPAGSMIVNSSRGGGSKDTWLMGQAGSE